VSPVQAVPLAMAPWGVVNSLQRAQVLEALVLALAVEQAQVERGFAWEERGFSVQEPGVEVLVY